MTAIDWDIAEHTDVVCPPDPNAECGFCGEALRHHINVEDPNGPVTPDAAVCIDSAALRRRKFQYLRFTLADGEALDCPNTGTDPVCDVEICSEHSTDFVTCVDSPSTLHHGDCRYFCLPCADAMAADARCSDG